MLMIKINSIIHPVILTINYLISDDLNFLKKSIISKKCEIEGLINVEVIVVILLINIFIVQYLISKDYSKYIPDNKFGKYLNIFLNRYVKIYSKSNKFIIGLCVCNLIMCIFATRFFIYCIMNH